MALARQEGAIGLLDARDELAEARQLVVALWLAAQAPTLPSNERAALCAVANVARDKLDLVVARLDEVLTGKIRSGGDD